MKKAKHRKAKINKNLVKIIAIFIIGILLIIYLSEVNNSAKEENKISQIVRISTNEEIQNNILKNQEKSKENQHKEEITNIEIPKEYKGFSVIAKLKIPKINLETYVLENYSVQALSVSVTKFYGGEPNEIGNFCISGHNYIVKNMFHNLKNLEINDEIYLTDLQNRTYKYKVYQKETVLPNETQCLSQKTNGQIELTLITCTTDSSKRIIVKAIKE